MEEKEKENNEVKSKFLRTLLRDDVYDRLEGYSKSLCTGMEKWDFGVGIERLLDSIELLERVEQIEIRMEELEIQIDSINLPKVTEKKKEEDEIPLLGPRRKIEDEQVSEQ